MSQNVRAGKGAKLTRLPLYGEHILCGEINTKISPPIRRKNSSFSSIPIILWKLMKVTATSITTTRLRCQFFPILFQVFSHENKNKLNEAGKGSKKKKGEKGIISWSSVRIYGVHRSFLVECTLHPNKHSVGPAGSQLVSRTFRPDSFLPETSACCVFVVRGIFFRYSKYILYYIASMLPSAMQLVSSSWVHNQFLFL